MVATPSRPTLKRDKLAGQLAAASPKTQFVRESRSIGVDEPPIAWRDTRNDLAMRSAQWRQALEASGLRTGDRVLLRLPVDRATGGDCQLALLEMDVLSMAADDPACVAEFQPMLLVTTPTDALRLSRTIDLTPSRLRTVVVTGELGGSIASTRRAIELQLGARCVDVYAMTETGVLGWSCPEAPGVVHLNTDAFAFDATPGQEDELVISTHEPRSTRLSRYATGDLVRLDTEGSCVCGATGARAEGGVLGRVSERVVVRGVELLPSSIEDVVRRHPAVREFALTVYRDCEITVQLEADPAIASEGDRARVAAEVSEDLKRSLGVRLQCEMAPPDSLGDQDAGRRARRFRRR